mgnify:FL=1
MTDSEKSKLIYVGPSLRHAQLMRHQIFIGGYPAKVDEIEKSCPNIRELFVPIDQLETAEKAVRTKGTPLNKYFRKAMEV